MKYIQSDNRKVEILFQYYSPIKYNEHYGFCELSEFYEFVKQYDVPKEEISNFISFIDEYKVKNNIPVRNYIYFTILSKKLVYSTNYVYINERILSYKENRELMSKDLVRIIECSKWNAIFDKSYNYVDITYTCKGDELGLLIYVYKGHVVLCREDGSNPHVYYCDNIRIVVDDSL